MVIFLGGKASGFKNVHDHDTYDADGTRLFQVRGTCDYDTRAEQKEEVSASLNSDDAFLLETPDKTYLWVGKVSQCSSFLKRKNSQYFVDNYMFLFLVFYGLYLYFYEVINQ